MEDSYFLKILIPFELLVDIDIGVVKVVTEKYNDTRYFDSSRLSNITDNSIYSFLFQYRKDINPLYLITKNNINDKEKGIVNNIYKELLEKEYIEILRHSQTTGIYDIFFAGNYGGGGPFRVTVICKNDLEIEYLRQINFKCNTIICKDNKELSNIDIDNYRYIYIKNIENILDYRCMTKKILFIANYRFNKEYVKNEELNQEIYILKPEFIIDLIGDNKINIIDVYPEPDNISI